MGAEDEIEGDLEDLEDKVMENDDSSLSVGEVVIIMMEEDEEEGLSVGPFVELIMLSSLVGVAVLVVVVVVGSSVEIGPKGPPTEGSVDGSTVNGAADGILV